MRSQGSGFRAESSVGSARCASVSASGLCQNGGNRFAGSGADKAAPSIAGARCSGHVLPRRLGFRYPLTLPTDTDTGTVCQSTLDSTLNPEP
jgi:hypothetical protein